MDVEEWVQARVPSSAVLMDVAGAGRPSPSTGSVTSCQPRSCALRRRARALAPYSLGTVPTRAPLPSGPAASSVAKALPAPSEKATSVACSPTSAASAARPSSIRAVTASCAT